MAPVLPYVAAAATGASVITGLQASKAEAKGYMSQAAFAKVQAKSEALKYKQQGVNVLENILATQATINARAAAGGIDPMSGSARSLYLFAQRRGVGEYYLTREGQTIAIGTGDAQAAQYVSTAKATMAAGRAQAFGKIASFAIGQSTLGSAPSGSGFSPTGVGGAGATGPYTGANLL